MQTALFTTKQAPAAAVGFHEIRGGVAQRSTVGGWGSESRIRISFNRKSTIGGQKLIARCIDNTAAGDVGDQAGGVQKIIEAEAQSPPRERSYVEFTGQLGVKEGKVTFVKEGKVTFVKEGKVTFGISGLPVFTLFLNKASSTKLAKVFRALIIGSWALIKVVWALRKGPRS